MNPRDQLHERAVLVSQSLAPVNIVTTDEVRTEFLNYFADRGMLLRQAAIGQSAWLMFRNPTQVPHLPDD